MEEEWRSEPTNRGTERNEIRPFTRSFLTVSSHPLPFAPYGRSAQRMTWEWGCEAPERTWKWWERRDAGNSLSLRFCLHWPFTCHATLSPYHPRRRPRFATPVVLSGRRNGLRREGIIRGKKTTILFGEINPKKSENTKYKTDKIFVN